MKQKFTKKELEQFLEGEVGFNIVRLNNKRVEFKVYHNLGERLVSAVICWVSRTKNYSAESLCEYINHKHSGDVCFTWEQWQPYYKKLFNLN